MKDVLMKCGITLMIMALIALGLWFVVTALLDYTRTAVCMLVFLVLFGVIYSAVDEVW